MRYSFFYWGLLAILGYIHLQALLNSLSFSFSFYFPIIFVLVICSILFKKVLFPISLIDMKWNLFLFGLQLLLIIALLTDRSSWISTAAIFTLFICIEFVRNIWANMITSYKIEINEVEEERAQMNETFRIVRSERHDFLKHIAAIDYMLEHNEVNESKEYLKELIEQYEETNLSIKGERGTVAGILHHMYRRANDAGIDVVYDLDVPISTLPLTNYQMVTLLGNLLSNSIDASIEWQQKTGRKALLTLQFYKRSGLYLLTCKNYSLPIPNEVLDHLYESYGKTTKSENHEGLGRR